MRSQLLKTERKPFPWPEKLGKRTLEIRACWGNLRDKRADVRGYSLIVSMNPQKSHLTHEVHMHRTDLKKHSKDL